MTDLRRESAWIWALASIATVIGMLAIWDAGYVRAAADGGVVPREFVSQGVAIVAAVIAGAACAAIRAKDWRRLAPLVYLLGLGCLIAVKVIGKEINGAQRWIELGFFNLQPSEVAKFAAILFLAAVFADRKPSPRPPRKRLAWYEALDRVWMPRLLRAWPLLAIGAYVLLIEAEPDLATAMVIAAVTLGMMILAGVRASSLLALGAVSTVVVGYMVMTEPYRMDRIVNHGSRWEKGNIDSIGYQTTQSEKAMLRGGLTGVGLGEGRAKHTLPAPTTDFVMTTISEETGLVGSLAVLAVLGGLTAMLFRAAMRVQTQFGKLVVAGVATWIGVQTCTNVMMANGFLPPIGVPLPFVSAGGSSLIALWAALGLCQSQFMAKAQGAELEAGHDRRWHRRPRVSGA
ncbi:MAG: FtsW/RodA/SpoVE family cell cycle protein [Fimbriimonadaceae bacterium]|nr:MAG: FtsW/RodA/SpoVE family cell cycle protein [Fimbriimonadaceae bacterium]